MTAREPIAALGAGRMGRGIAIAFAFAGHEVALVDFKPRDKAAFDKLAADALADIRTTLDMLARVGMLSADAVAPILSRVHVVAEADAAPALSKAARKYSVRFLLLRVVERSIVASPLSLGKR